MVEGVSVKKSKIFPPGSPETAERLLNNEYILRLTTGPETLKPLYAYILNISAHICVVFNS